MKKLIPHYYIYVFFLSIMAFGLSMGNIFMSIASIGLAVNWLVEMRFAEKWQQIQQHNYTPLVASLIFFVHLFWLINTQDIDFGVKELIMKLPLLSFPIVLGSIPKIQKKHWFAIMWVFIFGLALSCIFGFYRYYTFYHTSDFDRRLMSVFVSHIRLSLLLGIALFFLAYCLFMFKTKYKYLVIILIIYYLSFLRLIESGTGYVVLVAVLSLLVFLYVKKAVSKKKQFIIVATFFALSFSVAAYVYVLFRNQTEIRDTNDLSNLELQTPYGNQYEHNTSLRLVENGNYIWIYVCNSEAKDAWEMRSSISFDGKDAKNQPIYGTLYRYLTSLGLRKDYDGVMALSNHDIENIENGIATVVPRNNGFTARIQEVIFEMVNYQLNFNPNGHSVVQRILYFKAGYAIFKNNWLVGVGTGDGPISFETYYNFIDSPLYVQNRLRAHNQLLTFFINFGVIGALIVLFSLFYPFYVNVSKNVFLGVFFVIALISFCVDDTLETQAGVGFFVFFYYFFMYHVTINEK